MYVKNHDYILKVFKYIYNSAELRDKGTTPKLLLAGTGELMPEIKKKAASLKISRYVIFYGLSNNVGELLCAMDVFVMPSFSEGFPVVGIEAQASGVPVIFSDTITREARINKNVRFLPIDHNSVKLWGEAIINTDVSDRKDCVDYLQGKGYDIKDMVKDLVELYTKQSS